MAILAVIIMTFQGCVAKMVANKIINAPLFSSEDLEKKPNIGIVQLQTDSNISKDMLEIREAYLNKTVNKLSGLANVQKIDNFISKGTIYKHEIDKQDLMSKKQLNVDILSKVYYQAIAPTEAQYDSQIYNIMKKYNLDCLIFLSSNSSIVVNLKRIEFGNGTDIYTLNGEKVIKNSDKKLRTEVLWQMESVDIGDYWSKETKGKTIKEHEKLKNKIHELINKQVDAISMILFGLK